jgi:hypothetical protein
MLGSGLNSPLMVNLIRFAIKAHISKCELKFVFGLG